MPTVSAVTVLTMGPPAQRPVAVMKLGRSPQSRRDITDECRVLAALRHDQRLADWRDVFPQVLSFQADAPCFSIQNYVPGCDGRDVLLGEAGVARRGLSTSLAAIRELHQRTSVPAVIDDDLLCDLVNHPLDVLGSLFRPASWQRRCIADLGRELRGDLSGRAVTLSWVHGDLTPGNLLLSHDGSAVEGIVDWGSGSTPTGLPQLDVSLLLVSVHALREHRELGSVVAELLRRDGWPPAEQAAISAEPADIGYRSLILLTWMHHIASNLGKAAHYRRHPLWRAANIDVVLRELRSDYQPA